jgi:hypothetical protein
MVAVTPVRLGEPCGRLLRTYGWGMKFGGARLPNVQNRSEAHRACRTHVMHSLVAPVEPWLLFMTSPSNVAPTASTARRADRPNVIRS